jgi:hypothetical protein
MCRAGSGLLARNIWGGAMIGLNLIQGAVESPSETVEARLRSHSEAMLHAN